MPKLIHAGHEVVGVDIGWFGENLQPDLRLQTIRADFRTVAIPEAIDAVIHLAGIANDPCGDLDARLTWEVNALGTYEFARRCIKARVKRFIFASSASVYGIKDNVPVTEDAEFAPVSDYNKTKMVAERLLSTLDGEIEVQVVRPATICGVSPRQRLDVIVNLLTVQALEKGEITAHVGAHGGQLMRPHMHIEDVADLYLWLLANPEHKGPFNAASENQTVAQTAGIIASTIPCVIKFTETVDKRSYAVDFSRLQRAGFKPRRTVADAITDLAEAWRARRIKRTPMSVNLEWMRSNNWARAA